MKQESKSIYDFKVGDIITRIKPSKPIPDYKGEFTDRGYIGQPLKFLGCVNGCVNVERVENDSEEDGIPSFGTFLKLVSGIVGPITLPLDVWDEGWAYYVDPYKLSEKTDNPAKLLDKEVLNKSKLEKDLKIALINEEYEIADEIRKKLKKFN